MATYNGEQFIREQIDSILLQLGENDELVISDDQSRDKTLEIIQSYNDKRIKFFTHERAGRPTENFQNALNHAKGDYIFLSDQDDVWLPGKYDKMLALLSSYDLVLSDSILVDEDLKVIKPSFFKFHGSATGIARNVIKNSYFGSCMAFKRYLLDFALPFPPSREIGHDVWIGLIGEIVGKVFLIDEPLIMYRRHASAVTPHGIGKSKRSLYKKLMGRVIMFKYVYLFYFKYLINGKRISVHSNGNV
jgi:glycosyltransferase involved in cell wall biosynthesis